MFEQTQKLYLKEEDDHFVLKLYVTASASRDKVGPTWNEHLKVFVTAPPEDGKANAAVMYLLAHTLVISMRDVPIRSGHTARFKKVHIYNITKEQLIDFLCLALDVDDLEIVNGDS